MIARVIAQMFLAITVLQVVPVDAANLEWQVGVPTPPSALAGPLFSLTSAPVLPQAGERVPPPIKTDLSNYGVVTDAKSVVVLDPASGAVLFAKNPNDIRAIGSITKLMTVLVFLDTRPDLSSWVTLTEEDYIWGGRVYLNFQDPIRLRDVLGASVVGSDNTATRALSRLSGLSHEEFIAAMNNKAKDLGMLSSAFTEVTGIDSGNVSTARDLALLLQAAKAEQVVADFMRTDSLTLVHASGITAYVDSTDALIGSSLNSGSYRITGGKTGFIPEAGYCFVTTVARGKDEVFVAVLGASSKEDRFQDAKSLALWAFSTFTWPKL